MLKAISRIGSLHVLKSALRKVGIDVSRLHIATNSVLRRRQIHKTIDVDCVVDVGANIGQFAAELRTELGYRKRIISFEPIKSAFETLKKKSEKDANWEVHNFGFGSKASFLDINISNNSVSSSILSMKQAHLNAAPASSFIGVEKVELRTLDAELPNLGVSPDKTLLKIDAQGFEWEIMQGASKTLSSLKALQLELSLTELYDGEKCFNEIYPFLSANGFRLVSLDNGLTDASTGFVLQVDGVFVR